MVRWAPDTALRLENAAMELFAEHGYALTTVPSIAERAGLTTRTFFRHYADKRDVLFLRERELPGIVSRLVAAAPAGLPPMALVMHGIETIAASDLERWKPDIAKRRAIIRSEPQLRERELLKSAALADAIRDALIATGVPDADATLVASVGATVFDIAMEEWLGSDQDVSLVSVLRERSDRLKAAVTAPGAEPDSIATPTAGPI